MAFRVNGVQVYIHIYELNIRFQRTLLCNLKHFFLKNDAFAQKLIKLDLVYDKFM